MQTKAQGAQRFAICKVQSVQLAKSKNQAGTSKLERENQKILV